MRNSHLNLSNPIKGMVMLQIMEREVKIHFKSTIMKAEKLNYRNDVLGILIPEKTWSKPDYGVLVLWAHVIFSSSFVFGGLKEPKKKAWWV